MQQLRRVLPCTATEGEELGPAGLHESGRRPGRRGDGAAVSCGALHAYTGAERVAAAVLTKQHLGLAPKDHLWQSGPVQQSGDWPLRCSFALSEAVHYLS